MTEKPRILKFPAALKPTSSERTITVSYEHFLLLLDAFVDCAAAPQDKLKLLDDLYGLLPGNYEIGTRKVLAQNQDEQAAVTQMLSDLRAMRAEAEQQVD